MSIKFAVATESHAEVIAAFVIKLTEEICLKTNVQFFSIDLDETVARCRELIRDKNYGAIIGYRADQPIAMSTFTESYALYAGGKIGVIPEFYVDPLYRSSGVGAKLISVIKDYGRDHGWACIELCTPPLPEFERTLGFYQNNGLMAVGGRKMREYI
ncbi:GNAT family N-acetyltransferase [Cellvibrio sp. OA-2007]|uniref:GNAT family N-acetyltransferase n=1 Tax=Cellvibrio sp. OA-2007 TaxID=529823 RepID=UPI000782E4BD|nr:GNAT family N-acetyltransferase [Cellvibrio sp. OA-2007]